MQTVTVITAVDPATAHRLPQTANSVHAATHWLKRADVALEWVVIVDGPGPLPKFRSGENVIVRRTAIRVGPAAAKNLAAVAAHGQWLICLPADAELYAGALHELLSRDVGHLDWIVTHATSEPRPAAAAPPATLHPPGSLRSIWDRGLGFDPENLLVRRDAAIACGGWPAVPALENLALILTLNATRAGGTVPHAVFAAHTWDGSRHLSPGWPQLLTDARWTLANLLPPLP